VVAAVPIIRRIDDEDSVGPTLRGTAVRATAVRIGHVV
jgi:hypothetical protein